MPVGLYSRAEKVWQPDVLFSSDAGPQSDERIANAGGASHKIDDSEAPSAVGVRVAQDDSTSFSPPGGPIAVSSRPIHPEPGRQPGGRARLRQVSAAPTGVVTRSQHQTAVRQTKV